MVSYKTNELYSATEIAKNFSSIASKLTNHEIEKVGILKNNKLDFVMLRSDDFDNIVKKEVKKALLEENLQMQNMQISSMSKTWDNDEDEAWNGI